MTDFNFNSTNAFDFFSDCVNDAFIAIKNQQNALLIDQLKKYLPGVTLQNVGQYAHRLSQVTDRSINGMTRFYLDLGTANQVLLMELSNVNSYPTQVDGRVEITVTQKFKLF